MSEEEKVDLASTDARGEYLKEKFTDVSEVIKDLFFDNPREGNYLKLLSAHGTIRQEVWWQLSTILNLEILKELKAIKEVLRDLKIESRISNDSVKSDKKPSKKSKGK